MDDRTNIKPPKEWNKATDVEILERVKIVAEMIIKGYSKENIVRYCSENYNVGERHTENYIKRAKERFVEEAAAKDIENHLALAIQQLHDLYKKCYSIQDYAECRRIKKDIADLLGLQAPKKQDFKIEEITQRPQIIFSNGSKTTSEIREDLDD
jgi:hypothetical protein